MKTYLDCVPCIVRQALDSARAYSSDVKVQEKILREALGWCSEMDMSAPSPVTGRKIYGRLYELTGIKDPYLAAKKRQNAMAAGLLPELEKKLKTASDPFALAVSIAIAGNIIDMGGAGDVSPEGVRRSLEQALTEPLAGNVKAGDFRKAVLKAADILYLTDNAGEIYFDRLLIERLGPAPVIVAVRGAPVLNDALFSDAVAAGIDKTARVIDSGSDAPGTLLNLATPEFLKAFSSADIVIAKGMGNYETLCDSGRPVYFLFKAKCRMVAEHAGVAVGDHVLLLK